MELHEFLAKVHDFSGDEGDAYRLIWAYKDSYQKRKREESTSVTYDQKPEKDPLFENAKNCIASRWGPGDTITKTMLASKLHVPYSKASALIDQLEAASIISAPDPKTHRRHVL